MAGRLKTIGVLNSLQIESMNKLKDENEKLKKKNEKANKANMEWTKNCEEWKKNREKNKKVIEDLKKKIEGLKDTNEKQKNVTEVLNTKNEANIWKLLSKQMEIDALQKSKDEIENQTIEKAAASTAAAVSAAANEIEGLKKKYQDALAEIHKLARLVNIYGKKFLIRFKKKTD